MCPLHLLTEYQRERGEGYTLRSSNKKVPQGFLRIFCAHPVLPFIKLTQDLNSFGHQNTPLETYIVLEKLLLQAEDPAVRFRLKTKQSTSLWVGGKQVFEAGEA